jgi:iron complex outermembrane receptor protein
MTAKVRLAYGKGIRTPTSIHRATGPSKHRFQNPFLAPEEQTGVEGGFDLLFGSRLGLHLTRFDQLASGLIQEVLVFSDTTSSGPGNSNVTTWTQFQNVGEIANKGWEAQAAVSTGELSFAGALSTVSSRVQRLAFGYTGDLRAGDRMLGVPAQTLTTTATWTRRSFQLSTTLARASDWVNYDRLAIAKCITAELQTSGTCPDARALKTDSAGTTLRKYWTAYDGNTRLRMATSFDLRHGVTLMFTGENLLNRQRGEPDSITIVPGRTLTAGIRARF